MNLNTKLLTSLLTLTFTYANVEPLNSSCESNYSKQSCFLGEKIWFLTPTHNNRKSECNRGAALLNTYCGKRDDGSIKLCKISKKILCSNFCNPISNNGKVEEPNSYGANVNMDLLIKVCSAFDRAYSESGKTDLTENEFYSVKEVLEDKFEKVISQVKSIRDEFDVIINDPKKRLKTNIVTWMNEVNFELTGPGGFWETFDIWGYRGSTKKMVDECDILAGEFEAIGNFILSLNGGYHSPNSEDPEFTNAQKIWTDLNNLAIKYGSIHEILKTKSYNPDTPANAE